MPAVPWQSWAPFRCGPASQVSSPPPSSSSVSRSSSGAIVASEATIPGAPWHHCVLGPCPAPGGSSAGGHWQSPSSCWAYFSSVAMARCSTLRPAGRIEETASGEREDVARKAVGRAETVRRLAVEVLLPEIVAPLRQQERRPTPPTRSRHCASPVRSAITCAAIIVPGEPHISSQKGFETFARHRLEQRLLLPRAGASVWATSRIPDSPIRSDGVGSLGEILEVRLSPVVLDQPDRDGRPVAAEVDEAGALELVQRPDHARGAEVERRHGRQRPVLEVARMRGPQLDLVERALRLGDDLARSRPARGPRPRDARSAARGWQGRRACWRSRWRATLAEQDVVDARRAVAAGVEGARARRRTADSRRPSRLTTRGLTLRFADIAKPVPEAVGAPEPQMQLPRTTFPDPTGLPLGP